METTKVKTLEFFLLLTIVFIGMNLFFKSPVLIYIAVGTAGVGLFLNKVSYYVYLSWTRFSQFLAFIITHVILSLVFFLVLFPISLVYRMTKKDPLKLKPDSYSTLFENRSKTFDSNDLNKMW